MKNNLILKRIVMKSFAILLLTIVTGSILLAHETEGQGLDEVMVSLQVKNSSVKRVLEELHERTDFNFLYNEKDIRSLNRISIQVASGNLEDVLFEISKQTGLTFRRVNENIAVRLKEKRQEVIEIVDTEIDKKITGKVTDAETGEPLIGATIQVKGTTIGAVTDVDGNFSLSIPEDVETLVISYVGYKTIDVVIGGRTSFTIALDIAATKMDEVVVTALGIDRESKSIGYSLQEIDGKEFEQSSDLNIVNKMVGKVAGMEVNAATELLMSSGIKLRGANPLIVVDGVPINVDTWDLNFNDIEGISVLKGSTASVLYGSSGANGAILVTLKKGEKNKTTVQFTTTNLVQPWLLAYPKTQSEFGTGNNGQYEYVDGTGSGIEGGGFTWGPKLDGRLLPQWNSPIDPETGERIPIPWEDKTGGKGNLVKYLETGFLTTNNINIETGNDRGSYRISFSHSFQDGIVPNTKLNISGFSVGGTYNLSDKFKMNTSLNYSRQYSPNYRIPSYGPHDYFYSLAFWLAACRT